ncbi:hypothetical protein [Flavobacterium defluvii]|uniref:CheY chemotaxis protein or a CheY-like REC (Receiver) domain n=1 Tax=Flavobacterium defluvii TaxID=370979 RepID=A0A1M5IWP1_9FLAO|nr:hypothetical protein [Flavobacterium defluvii]SHG32479.1 hypothetical protein SAMN05443663_102527 [Flavobacterium defluvii]
MTKTGPIIIIEENVEDRNLFAQIFWEFNLSNELLYFNTLNETQDYIASNKTELFLLFSNVLQFHEENKQDNYKNYNSICLEFNCPCLFYSIQHANCFIIDTYSIPTQSYFITPFDEEKFKSVLNSIVEYWLGKKSVQNDEIPKSEKESKFIKKPS